MNTIKTSNCVCVQPTAINFQAFGPEDYVRSLGTGRGHKLGEICNASTHWPMTMGVFIIHDSVC